MYTLQHNPKKLNFTLCNIIAGRSAYIGLGFGDRSDSFDLNVALQDHFKWLRKEQEGEQGQQQQLDLSFKEGETIKINMKITVSNPLINCKIIK